jgi:hypothetical protein
MDNSLTDRDLYDTLPDIFEHMMVESSPWSDVFQSSESLLILSCCAPHVILHASKTFLSSILKTSLSTSPQTPALSPLRVLFGTQLEALASPSHPLSSAADFPSASRSSRSRSNPHQKRDHHRSLFQNFYSNILTLGSGQLVTSFYDSCGQSQLCLLHGYPIHNLDQDSPFDFSLYRPTQHSDRSSSGRQLSSVSLSSSHYSTLEPLHPISNLAATSAVPPKLTPTAREVQKSGQILYFVVAVSPLQLMNESPAALAIAHDDSSHSIHSGSSHLGGSASVGSYSSPFRGSGRTLGQSPRLKRTGSDGTVSQNLFLLYEMERSLSVAEDHEEELEKEQQEDGEDGVYVQEDPYEGITSDAAFVSERPASTASWTHLVENPSLSRDPVDATGEPQGTIRASCLDSDLLNDL